MRNEAGPRLEENTMVCDAVSQNTAEVLFEQASLAG